MSVDLIATLQGHDDAVWCVCWHPKKKLLASCSADRTIRLWSEEAGKWTCVCVLSHGHTRSIRRVRWSPCGSMLASCSFDATAIIWKFTEDGDMEQIAELEGHQNEVKSVSWSISGDYLATCSRDKTVWIWQRKCLSNYVLKHALEGDDEEFELLEVLQGHKQDVKFVVWSPVEDILASTSYDDTVKLYVDDGDSWSSFSVLDGHTSTVWACDFNDTGDMIVSVSEDKSIILWTKAEANISSRFGSWKLVHRLDNCHSRAIYDVAWCKMTGLIATACGDNAFRILKVLMPTEASESPKLELIHQYEESHSQDVNSVSFSPNVPGLLATCSDDKTIKIWKIHN